MTDKPKKDSKKEENSEKGKSSSNEEKFPVIELIEQSSLKHTMILGALDYNDLLNDFKEDMINETNNLQLTQSEFEEIIRKYQNRRV